MLRCLRERNGIVKILVQVLHYFFFGGHGKFLCGDGCARVEQQAEQHQQPPGMYQPVRFALFRHQHVVNNFGDEWRIAPCTVNRVGKCVAIDEERTQIVGYGIVIHREAKNIAALGCFVAVTHLWENQTDVALLQGVVLLINGGTKLTGQHINAFYAVVNMGNIMQVLQTTVCVAVLPQTGIKPFFIGHYQTPPDCNA